MKQFFHIATIALLVATHSASGITLNLFDSNRVTIQATNTPLYDLLRGFARAGIMVKVDTRVANRTIAFAADNRELEQVLPQILADDDYILVWDVIRGPLGTIPRLAEIQVFPRGADKRLSVLTAPQESAPATNTITRIRVVPDEILLQLKPGTSIEAFRALLRQINGNVIDAVPNLGIYRIRLPPQTDLARLLTLLATMGLVNRAEPNIVYEAPHTRLNKNATAPAGGTGSPAIPPLTANASAVAVMDTGLATNCGLDRLVLAGLDSVNPLQPLTDTRGHGTQMAYLSSGIIAPDGITADSTASVPIIPVRTFDENGLATSFSFLRAVDFAVVSGARVLSMSWVSEVSSSFMADTLAAASARGLVLVAAAGNEPSGTTMYPAALPGVLAVSAVDSANQRWNDSNYGTWVDLAAPGFAAFTTGTGTSAAGDYVGTSIATAFVANSIARYLAAHPQATATEAIDKLKSTLTTNKSGSFDKYLGYGILDQAALSRYLAK